MRAVNKKRLANLERAMIPKRSQPRCAMVCLHGESLDFNQKVHQIDAKVVLVLPDNGRRSIESPLSIQFFRSTPS